MNEREKKVLKKYKNKGWKAIRYGAPDFLFLKTDDGEIRDIKFVEVKSQKDNLRHEQKLWKKAIESYGGKFKLEVIELDTSEKKTIKIDPETHKALKKIGKKGESFNDILLRLVSYYENGGNNNGAN